MRIVQKLKKSGFLVSVMSVGIGNLIGQGLSVISVPILSRIYSVEAYGEYGIIVSSSTIIISFATLGLMSAIMVPKDDEQSNIVFTSAFWVQFVLSLVVAVTAIVISPFYRFHEVKGSYWISIIIMWLYVFITSVKNILYVSINRKGLNKVLLWNPIIGGCANILIAIPLGLLKIGYQGFFIAAIIGEVLMCIQMVLKYNPFIRHFSVNRLLSTFRKYHEFILFQCPANAIETYTTQFPTQFLSRTFDSNVLGVYGMCVKLMQYPVLLIAQPISTVYFRTATRYKEKHQELSSFTYTLITRILLIAIIPIVIISLFGQELFVIILGSKWAEAGKMASLLVYQYALLFATKCVSYCRVSIGKQRMNFGFQVANLVVTVLLCIVGYRLTHQLLSILLFFTVGRCIMLVADIAIDFFCMRNYFVRFMIFIIIYSVAAISLMVFL